MRCATFNEVRNGSHTRGNTCSLCIASFAARWICRQRDTEASDEHDDDGRGKPAILVRGWTVSGQGLAMRGLHCVNKQGRRIAVDQTGCDAHLIALFGLKLLSIDGADPGFSDGFGNELESLLGTRIVLDR